MMKVEIECFKNIFFEFLKIAIIAIFFKTLLFTR